MEALPVEVIGNILSHVEAARDVTVASGTCRKWRDAACRHLHRLSFHHADWAEYKRMTAEKLEVVITQTILRTTCLRQLSICFEIRHFFSSAPVVAWLMHTRATLRCLTYTVQTSQTMEVLHRCGRHKLEALALGRITVSGKGSGGFQSFPVLTTLTLSEVRISGLDLNLLMSACPKLLALSLIDIDVLPEAHEDLEDTIELSSVSVRSFLLQGLRRDGQVVLKLDNLEVLSVEHSCFETLEVVCKGNLRVLSIDDVLLSEFDVGQCKHLEAVDVVSFNAGTNMWPRLYRIIAAARGLRRLKLWGLPLFGLPLGNDPEDDMGLDLGAVAVCCPLLCDLSLGYDHIGLPDRKTLTGSAVGFQKVCRLEVSSTVIDGQFASWLQELVERCPSLKQLVLHGLLSSQLSEAKGQEEYQMVADFTTAMVGLMRKLSHVAVEFHYT